MTEANRYNKIHLPKGDITDINDIDENLLKSLKIQKYKDRYLEHKEGINGCKTKKKGFILVL